MVEEQGATSYSLMLIEYYFIIISTELLSPSNLSLLIDWSVLSQIVLILGFRETLVFGK